MIRQLAIALALFGLTGCLSFIPEPEAPTALYRLGPVEMDETLPLAATVLIRQPEAPRILAGKEIIARDHSEAIRLVDGVEWADRATRLMQLTLLDHLASTGKGLAVLPETGARGEYELSWRISEFALKGRQADARLELTLLNARDRKPIAQDIVETQVTASSSSNSARAEALAEAGRLAIGEAAETLSRRIKEDVERVANET